MTGSVLRVPARAASLPECGLGASLGCTVLAYGTGFLAGFMLEVSV